MRCADVRHENGRRGKCLEPGLCNGQYRHGPYGRPLYGGWARNLDGSQNLDRIINYGYRAIHLASVASKQLVGHYYKADPALSYFSGGSNGGRQALIEAQRYPLDFDGIIADRPAIDFPGFMSAFIKHATTEYPVDRFHPVLPPSLMPLLGRATMRKCDGVDGLGDGIISDPLKCQFDPERELPLCQRDVAGSDCFTRAQIGVIKTVYQPKVVKTVGTIYPLQGRDREDRCPRCHARLRAAVLATRRRARRAG